MTESKLCAMDVGRRNELYTGVSQWLGHEKMAWKLVRDRAAGMILWKANQLFFSLYFRPTTLSLFRFVHLKFFFHESFSFRFLSDIVKEDQISKHWTFFTSSYFIERNYRINVTSRVCGTVRPEWGKIKTKTQFYRTLFKCLENQARENRVQ